MALVDSTSVFNRSAARVASSMPCIQPACITTSLLLPPADDIAADMEMEREDEDVDADPIDLMEVREQVRPTPQRPACNVLGT